MAYVHANHVHVCIYFFFSWRASLIRLYSLQLVIVMNIAILLVYIGHNIHDDIHNLSRVVLKSLLIFITIRPSMCTGAHFGGREFFQDVIGRNGWILKTLFRRVSEYT